MSHTGNYRRLIRRAAAFGMFLLFSAMLCGCAANTDKSTFYVYEIELDKDEAGFRLYVTGEPEETFLDGKKETGSDSSDGAAKGAESEKSSGENPGFADSGKNAAGQADSGRTKTAGQVLVYGGKTPKAAFDAFFADQADVYTGTLERYIWGETLNEEDLFAAALYLLDSPSLPLKVYVRGET